LFENKYIVRVSDVDKDLLEEVLAMCKESENVFLFVEGALDTKTKKLFEVSAEKVWECESGKEITKEVFNTFALTDALLARNRGKAWVLYEEAKRKGVTPEEVHGVLWWQLKTMLLVSKTQSATEAGVKPFVYSKTKKGLVHFAQKEVEGLVQKLLDTYTQSRKGKIELSIGLEQFLLGI